MEIRLKERAINMATIRERAGTYQIRVSAGYNVSGKQIVKTLSCCKTNNKSSLKDGDILAF